MIEQDVVNYIQGELARRGIFYLNVLGSYMTTSTGQPDIVACVGGEFVAIECKLSTAVSTTQFRRGLELIASGGRFVVANKDVDVDKLLAKELETIHINPNSDAEALATPKGSVEYIADYSIKPLMVKEHKLSFGERVAKEKYETARAKAREKAVATTLEERVEMKSRPVFYPETVSEVVFVDWSDTFTESASDSASEKIKKSRFALLNAKTGVGKTSAGVATAGKLAEDVKENIPVAIIAPTSAIQRNSWIKHINAWNATHEYKLEVFWHVSPRGFTLAMKEPSNVAMVKKTLGKKGILLIDEAHDFKNPTSKGARSLAKLNTFNKLAITATDITNDKLRDISSYLIMAGYYTSFNNFLNKENLKQLRNKSNKFLIYNEKGEIDAKIWSEWNEVERKWREIHVNYKVPPLVSFPNVVEKTLKIHSNEELISDINSVLTAHRLSSYDTPKQAYQVISDRIYTDSKRISIILDIISDKNVKQPLIFYINNTVKDAIANAFLEKGISYQEVSGNTKASDFNDKDLSPVLVQYKSGGASIEFLHSNVSIFAQNQPSIGMLNQAKGRNVRRGMTGDIHQYTLHTDVLFDTRILERQAKLIEIADKDFEKNFLDQLTGSVK